jgi:hypothetical protein
MGATAAKPGHRVYLRHVADGSARAGLFLVADELHLSHGLFNADRRAARWWADRSGAIKFRKRRPHLAAALELVELVTIPSLVAEAPAA